MTEVVLEPPELRPLQPTIPPNVTKHRIMKRDPRAAVARQQTKKSNAAAKASPVPFSLVPIAAVVLAATVETVRALET